MREKAQNGDDLDVVIYFWDQQDTDGDCGWWIGPSIGGELVWAYHPSKAVAPPPVEWSVPHDGPIDKTFSVAPAQQLSSKEAEARSKKAKRKQEEAYAGLEQIKLPGGVVPRLPEPNSEAKRGGVGDTVVWT
eukprot:g29682.t1